jgi:hypothetical protein
MILAPEHAAPSSLDSKHAATSTLTSQCVIVDLSTAVVNLNPASLGLCLPSAPLLDTTASL